MQFVNGNDSTSHHPLKSVTTIELTQQVSVYEFEINDPRLLYIQIYIEPKDLIYIEEVRDNQIISVLPISSKFSLKFTPSKRILRFRGEGKVKIFTFRFICP